MTYVLLILHYCVLHHALLIKKKIFLTASPSPQFGWLGPDPEPWVFRGGLSGEFQVKLFF